jgi:hypothetical protein
MPIVVETAGATIVCDWSVSIYATGNMVTPTNASASARAWFGTDSSPVFALAQFTVAGEKSSASNTWMTTVPTAGTYTAKIVATTPALATMSNYGSIKVVVSEVV